MAYKQKKPAFFGSALKQYYNYENEDKKEISKEEFVKLSNQGAHVGPEGQVAIDLWKESLSGKTGIDEIDAMSKNEKQTEYSRALEKLKNSQRDLNQEEMNNAETSPMKATPGYSMLMKGAGGGKFDEEGKKVGAGTNYYTHGDLSYRGEWDSDLIHNFTKDKEDLENGDDDDNDGGDDGGGGDDDDGSSSSFNIKWPKLFNKNNTEDQNNYVTTACAVFGEPGSENYRRGMAENKRTMSKKEWKIFKRQQRNKFDSPMW